MSDSITEPLNTIRLQKVKSLDEISELEFRKLRKSYNKQSLDKKVDFLSIRANRELTHIKGCTYDTNYFRNNIENPIGIVQIPLGLAGPIEINGKFAMGNFHVPMATTEGALLLTYDLGMRLLKLGDPVHSEVLSKVIHLDPMFPIDSQDKYTKVNHFIVNHFEELRNIAESKSSHTKLLSIEPRLVKSNLVLKCSYDTADAHGLNMINEATFNMCLHIESKTGVHFFHRSHYSGVKHHSLRNEREGYGRRVVAKAVITEKALSLLGVNALQMKDFTDRCIECGTAAEISSINVHAANGITAICLATGQDMADISSSHVCKAACRPVNNNKDLYYELEIPNLLIATVGGGTGLGTQRECLEIMECYGTGQSDKFAEIIAAAALAGEFPTAAAVINRSYVEIHNKYGRNKNKQVL